MDCGSARSIIPTTVSGDFEPRELLKGSEQFFIVCRMASREVLPNSRVVSSEIEIESFSWMPSFLVPPTLEVNCILGADLISKCGPVLDLHVSHYYFNFNRRVIIPWLGHKCTQDQIQEIEV